jgi:TRAP-type C4-dicarboxylate transport system substrate-binding protein
MPKILISYRRSDSQATAGRIFDRLVERFGETAVFMDIDAIPFGSDFRTHIEDAVRRSDVLIAVVGPQWLGRRDDGGTRIDEPTDPVRVELEGAIAHGIPIIPVLIDGARMPNEAELPAGLKQFSFFNAAPVDSGRDFRSHLDRLIRALDGILVAKGVGAGTVQDMPGSSVASVKVGQGVPPPRGARGTSRSRMTYAALALGVIGAVVLLLWTLSPWLSGAKRDSVPTVETKQPQSDPQTPRPITLKMASKLLVPLLAKEFKAANTGLDIEFDEAMSLLDSQAQWNALVAGQLDLAAFSLDLLSDRVPIFGATLLPGVVRNYEHAKRVNSSGFLTQIKRKAAEEGVLILVSGWISRLVLSKKGCIRLPPDARGVTIQTYGSNFKTLWRATGASVADVGLEYSSKAVDATHTNTAGTIDVVSLVKCVTLPGDFALGFEHHPILMSKVSFNRLNNDQRNTILTVAKEAERELIDGYKGLDDYLLRVLGTAGVETITLSQSEYDTWLRLIQSTVYKEFAAAVPEGKQLIDAALAAK